MSFNTLEKALIKFDNLIIIIRHTSCCLSMVLNDEYLKYDVRVDKS